MPDAPHRHPTFESEALLRLSAAGGPTAPRRRLLEQHGDPSQALRAGAKSWRKAGLDARQIDALQAPDAGLIAHACHWLEHPCRWLLR